MTVSAEYAATHLHDLFSAASRGEEIEISQLNRPTLKLVLAAATEHPVAPKQRISGTDRSSLSLRGEQKDANGWQTAERPRSELFGSLVGKLELTEDWDSPETNRHVQELFEHSHDVPTLNTK